MSDGGWTMASFAANEADGLDSSVLAYLSLSTTIFGLLTNGLINAHQGPEGTEVDECRELTGTDAL